jgi:SAM-dependent methyltransferase
LSELSGDARRNRAAWDLWAREYVRAGERAWATPEPYWGIWGIPERELAVLPDVADKDVLELGCGTAYFSSWLARRGARVVGLDNSPQQLETARRLQAEHRLDFSLVLASADDVPLPDGSFDLVLSEYGASLWVDPYRWVPEAARLLRPGGELVFLTNGLVLMLTMPTDGVTAGDRLVRDLFGMHRFEWPDDDSVEFHLPHGEWIRLLVANGFAVEALVELRAPEGGDPGQWDFVTFEWARRWPSEEIWKARKGA